MKNINETNELKINRLDSILDEYESYISKKYNSKITTARYSKYSETLLEEIFDRKSNHIYLEDLKSINSANLELSILELKEEKDWKSSTTNLYIASIKNFFDYLGRIKRFDNDIYKLKSIKKDGKRNMVYVKQDELDEFWDVLEENYNTKYKSEFLNLRYMTIISLMTFGGLRKSEIIGLQVDDLKLKKENAKLTLKGNKLVVIGKGDKQRTTKIFNSKTEKYILRYLELRKKILKENNLEDEKAMFIADKTFKRISSRVVVDSVNMLNDDLEKTLGIKLTPHKLRHTFATAYYKNTKDISTLKSLLGHSNISTTNVYLHAVEEDFEDLELF